jgi:NADPH:quinone reductase-like Zn-dependent oxidoreductase
MAQVAYGENARGDLMRLTDLIEDGKVTPVVHRSYSFGEIPAAIAYVEQGHASGKVVVTV